MSSARATNLLGALALGLNDELRRATEQCGEHGASGPAALVVIGTYPGRTIDELRPALELTHSGTVRLIDRLAESGLVERRAGKDARCVSLYLTPAGRAEMRSVLAARAQALEAATAALTEAERRQLELLSSKILAGLTDSQARADHICRLCNEAVCPTDRCPVECALH